MVNEVQKSVILNVINPYQNPLELNHVVNFYWISPIVFVLNKGYVRFEVLTLISMKIIGM